MTKRLLAAMVGLVLIVLIAHDVPLSSHLAQIERARLITSIERDAFTIGGRVTPLMKLPVADRAIKIIAVLDSYSQGNDGIVVVIDAEGYLAATNDQNAAVGDDYVRRPEIATALLGNPSSGSRASLSLGQNLVYVAVPVLSGADVLGVVRITYPQSGIDARVRAHQKGILLTATISIAMAILVALLFARFVSKPLDSLQRTTENFADGDLFVKAREFGPPETRKLAASFNRMAIRLGGMIDRQRSFAGDASHQLRTPLTALRLRLELASDLVNSDLNAARENIDAAQIETERLAHLVDQLLQLARAEGVTLLLEDFSVSGLVSDRVEQWLPLAEERGVVLTSEIRVVKRGHGNAFALGEIIDNYLDNALEVSSSGGQVLVAVCERDGDIEVMICDDGPGLSDEQRIKAFGRFWRGGEQSNRRLGSGLGLAIVAQLADASSYEVELRRSVSGGIEAVVAVPQAQSHA